MNERDERRLAANEVVFREVNESILRGQWPGEDGETVQFRCECSRLGCNLLIGMTVSEYEELRRHSRRFVLIDGHELPEIERVVTRRSGHVIVEKTNEAAEVGPGDRPARLSRAPGGRPAQAGRRVRQTAAPSGRCPWNCVSPRPEGPCRI